MIEAKFFFKINIYSPLKKSQSNTPPPKTNKQYSRYKADFEEVAFSWKRRIWRKFVKSEEKPSMGTVFYAVKKIRLNPEDQAKQSKKILRESHKHWHDYTMKHVCKIL